MANKKMNIFERMVKESKGKRLSRAKAIRYKCLDCCSFDSSEVKKCTCDDCPLWRYRMGHEEKDELYMPRNSKEKTL